MTRTSNQPGVVWRKSSYSGENGACVEVTAWRKSSHSGANGACVEVTASAPEVAIRDSKLGRTGLVLRVPARAWRTFTATLG
jgi:hypothetical protein